MMGGGESSPWEEEERPLAQAAVELGFQKHSGISLGQNFGI